jgi:hypothetical protein
MATSIDITFSDSNSSYVPTLLGGIKKVISTESNIPYKFIEEYTLEGLVIAFNNSTGATDIWTKVDALSQKIKDKVTNDISININGTTFSNIYRITSINFQRPSTPDQDVKSKNFSISFERHVAVADSLLSTYGVSNLEQINSIDFSITSEQNVNSVTITKNLNIQYTTIYEGNICEESASSVFNLINSIFTTYSKGRKYTSQTCDQRNKSLNVQERMVTFDNTSQDFGEFLGYELSIQNNGVFTVTENGNIQSNNDSHTMSALKAKAESLKSGAFTRCQNFTTIYYQKLNLIVASYEYNLQNLPISSNLNVDGSNMSATYSVTYSNDPRNVTDVIVNISEEVSSSVLKDEVKKVQSGSVLGMGVTDFASSNQKFSKAKTKYQSLYSSVLSAAKNLDNQQNILSHKYPSYLTNANVTFNISEGSINFNHTFVSNKGFDSKDTNFVSVSAEATSRGPLHLVNSFLIFGGVQEGKELIQDVAQGKVGEINLTVDFLLKPNTTLDQCIAKFKLFIDKIKKARGFLKDASYTLDPVGRTFNGTATFLEFDKYRELKDLALKAEAIDVDI